MRHSFLSSRTPLLTATINAPIRGIGEGPGGSNDGEPGLSGNATEHAVTRPRPPVHACYTPRARPVHAPARMHARLNTPRARPCMHSPCTPLHARACAVHVPCMCRACAVHAPGTVGHTDASLSGDGGFANGKRHLGYHTEGPRHPPGPSPTQVRFQPQRATTRWAGRAAEAIQLLKPQKEPR